MALNLVSKMDLSVDSRGKSLSDGDLVLCYIPDSDFMFRLGRIVSSQGINTIVTLCGLHYRLDKILYVFKLNEKSTSSTSAHFRHEIDQLLAITSKYSNDDAYLESFTRNLSSVKTLEDAEKLWKDMLCAYTMMYHAEMRYHCLKIPRNILYDEVKFTQHFNGMYTRDVTFKKLAVGDLVVAYDVYNHKLNYGVLISKSEVFLENNEKKLVSAVYKILNPTDEEKEIQQRLLKLSVRLKQGNLKRELKPGYVYQTEDYAYVYLGKCRLDIGYAGDSSVLIKANTLEFPEKVYLKIRRAYPNSAIHGITESNFKAAFIEGLSQCLGLEKHKYYLDSNSFAVYYTLETIKTDDFVSASHVTRRAQSGFQPQLPSVYTLNVDNSVKCKIPEYLENLSFTFTFYQ